MKPVRLLCLVLVLTAFLSTTSLSWAQTATTSLSGTVTDARQAVVQGAAVTLSNPQTGFSRNVKSDSQGVYQFLQLPPATYTIEVNANGFAPLKREGLQLLVSVPVTQNLTVEVQGQTVTVEVAGDSTHVNTTDATMGNAFNTRQIMDLPFEGRNVVEILSLQPGVTYTGASGLGSGSPVDRTQDTRNGSVNGGRSDQANITLDGVDNNDQNNGFAFEGALRSTLDSVEEFRVTTANSNADAGRSSGAQVTLVTKAGTNQWHGSAYEYNRSGIGEANEWFNKNSQVTNGLPNKPGHLVRNTYGATLGGPVKKDRAFFFLNWEAQRKQETTQTTRIVPSDNLRNGIISYACVNVAQPGGAPADPLCVPGSSNPNVSIAAAAGLGPGQLLATLTPGTLQALDPNCAGNGTCPSGAGANPNVQSIFAAYPHANASSGANANAVADGFNYQGYNFAGATALKLNTYIAKLDFNLTQNGNHRLFIRGNLQGDRFADVPQFPGDAPTQTTVVPSKGLAVGYTALLSPALINNFRYGFIRQAIDTVGSGNKTFITLRGIDTPHGEEFDSSDAVVPVHNFVDDISWTKGKHTLQVGANFRMIGDLRNSTLTSFSGASTNASWLDVSGIANKGESLDPAAPQFSSLNLPAVDAGFNNSYDYPVMALAGIVSEVDARYNFDIKGNTLAEGTPNIRHFVAHEFETYVQDSWRIKSNLTLTYGLRWTLLQPPYEKNGVQVAPTVSLNSWFQQRGQTMQAGLPFNQPIEFDLSGQANNRKPYWGYDYKNFAPRVAIAYSPGFDSGWLGHLFGGQGKSSIRMGAGMYYDHFGEGIVNTFDKNGSFGLSTLLSNPGGSQQVDSAPRIDANGLYTLPPALITPSPGASFPVVFPLDNFAVQWGLDDKLKTPYSYAFDFSFERELPHNFIIETAYVGRIAHHLLQQEDLGQPRDIVDPASKTDYYSAIRQLDNLALTGPSGVDESAVTAIPYWENLFGATSAGPGGASGCASGAPANPTATQNMYDLLQCGYVHNETTFQQIIDGVGGSPCFPGCITLKGVTATTPQYFASQFASLYAWRSIGNSAYNAAQVLLKHPMSHGIQFDLNYTFSKSIDMGSDAERIGGSLDNTAGLGDQIYNAWNPKLQRAISTFDTTHQLNSNWIAELPFGHGRAFGANAGRVLDTAFGGWQLTGLLRWTSGFPVSVNNGAAWATNWDLGGYATQIAPAAKTGVFRHADGSVGLFSSPVVASGSYRQDFPGEVGQRNTLRGPGYFGVDMGMDKTFKITENHLIRFSWEVFNVFNTVRFNVQSAGIEPDVQSTFGNYSNTLTQSRRMQFALRYSF